MLTAALNHTAPALTSAFPALLDLRVWGSIIGMFELNNLELYVASPVPAWAQEVAERTLSSEETAAVESHPGVAAAGGLDGIMSDEDEWAVVGNAFYSLQACINHSCLANAHAYKREEDRDGKGERFDSSYGVALDEKERQALLNRSPNLFLPLQL